MKFESLSPENISIIFLSLGVLLFSSFVFGKLFTLFKAPKVIGEIFGGFVLGQVVCIFLLLIYLQISLMDLTSKGRY
ncbi:hypothetical protein [Campylobacter jejuni]|uniref:hypothetical protein n=1 Tax=Campylobacter jejuni TaxID=197 RepID=UPI0018753C46|nr:hypothetical protein [Campylobacter jejuni]EFU4977320.1 hypothetical protein [Campylobacter jejuni]ELM0865690.1 hypothetical protein [Campylobacter jejuni]HBK2098444.1 hypothetical protein [Campylobacter jejuni]